MAEIRIFTKSTPWILKPRNLAKFFKGLSVGLMLWIIWFAYYIDNMLQGELLKPIINYFK